MHFHICFTFELCYKVPLGFMWTNDLWLFMNMLNICLIYYILHLFSFINYILHLIIDIASWVG